MARLRQQLVSAFTRRYPFLSGCGTFANSSLVKMISGDDRDRVWARLDCGLEILVPMDDYVGRSIYYVGDLDRKISGVVKRVVRPGDQVLDIGANLGIVTLPLAMLTTASGVVHSFEPNPAVRDLLTQSVKKNALSQVRVHACALGAEEGEMSLSYPKDNFGKGTLTRHGSGDGWTSVPVPVRVLSNLAEELGLNRVRLVKIDVEGHELEILRGARRWMETHPPDVILFESNGDPAEHEADGVLSLLADLDYAFYSIPRNLVSLRLVPYRKGGNEAAMSHDVAAIHRRCESEVLARFKVQGAGSTAHANAS